MTHSVSNKTLFFLKFQRTIATCAFLLFLNFTFSLQYISFYSDNSTLTEIVEEVEEELEYENDVFDLLLNNHEQIQLVSYLVVDESSEIRFPHDVMTPPPELV